MPHPNQSPAPVTADQAADRQAEIADVTGMTMLELLQSRDSQIIDGVQELVAQHRIQPLTASWSSFLDPGPAGDDLGSS